MKSSEFVDRIIDKYTDNEGLHRLLITHSRHVAGKALEVTRSGGLADKIDFQFVWDAAMLHDIGIVKCNAPSIYCFGQEPYIRHGVLGGEILRKEGLPEEYARVCERHTGSGLSAEDIKRQELPLPERDFLPETPEEKLICYADKFFSKSGNPTVEKSRERVVSSIQRHGAEALERFFALEKSLFL